MKFIVLEQSHPSKDVETFEAETLTLAVEYIKKNYSDRTGADGKPIKYSLLGPSRYVINQDTPEEGATKAMINLYMAHEATKKKS